MNSGFTEVRLLTIHHFQNYLQKSYINYNPNYIAMCLPVYKFGVLNHSTFNNLRAHPLLAAIALRFTRNKPKTIYMFPTRLMLKKETRTHTVKTRQLR